MSLFLFVCSKLTYKRFLLFWGLTGMLFTHSWLTEPHSPDLAHQIAKNGNLLCGFFVVIFFLFSLFVTKSNFHFKISGYVINIALYFLMAIFSDYFNNSSITVYEIMQLAIPIAFGLSFIYSFTKKDINKILFFKSKFKNLKAYILLFWVDKCNFGLYCFLQ